jgi:hypothetical protein
VYIQTYYSKGSYNPKGIRERIMMYFVETKVNVVNSSTALWPVFRFATDFGGEYFLRFHLPIIKSTNGL